MGRFEYSCINIYCIYSNFFLQTKNLCRCFKQIFHSLNTSSNMFHMSIKYWKGVGQVLRLTTLSLKLVQGRIQDFKLGEAHLKTLRWTEGGAKMFGVFRMKNHDFTPKNLIFFPILGGRVLDAPPWIRPCLTTLQNCQNPHTPDQKKLM